MSGANQKLLLSVVIVFIFTSLLSGCNMVDPATEVDENTAPDVFLFDFYNPLVLVPGQMRQGTILVADYEQDQVVLRADGSISPSGDPILTYGATFNESTALFAWKPLVTVPVGDYAVRFTATDNGSPSLSGSADLPIVVTDTLGLGDYLNQLLCDTCHVNGQAGSLRELQVPCDEDGLEVALHSANIAVPDMQPLGLSVADSQVADLVTAYNIDINAVAVYLSDQYSNLDYVCSVANKSVVVNSLLQFSLLNVTGNYTVQMQSVTVEGETKPYPGASGATVGLTTGVFSWTPSAVGEYAVNFIITRIGESVPTFDEVMYISVTPDNSGLGEELYTQHCVGCHLTNASRYMPNILTFTTPAQITTAIQNATASVASMAGFATILDASGRTALGTYICGLGAATNCN